MFSVTGQLLMQTHRQIDKQRR